MVFDEGTLCSTVPEEEDSQTYNVSDLIGFPSVRTSQYLDITKLKEIKF